jgi:hypothetical protein
MVLEREAFHRREVGSLAKRMETPMRNAQPSSGDVEAILLNARLRDELEPFFDESVHRVDVERMPTHMENEFLMSMLAWERAPVLPIGRWFEPELVLPQPDSLDDQAVHEILWETIHRLYEKRIVLELTDHLTDRQLYTLIFRDILPSYEKKVELPKNYLHWHCLDDDSDPQTWLRYYASEEEREGWAAENGYELPPSEMPPYPRKMPRRAQ